MIRKPKFRNLEIIVYAQILEDCIFMRYDGIIIPVTREEFYRRIKNLSWHYETMILKWVEDVFNIKNVDDIYNIEQKD